MLFFFILENCQRDVIVYGIYNNVQFTVTFTKLLYSTCNIRFLSGFLEESCWYAVNF